MAIPAAGADACLYRHQGYIGKRENLLGSGFPVGGAAISVDDSLRIIDTGRIYHASNAQIAPTSQQRQSAIPTNKRQAGRRQRMNSSRSSPPSIQGRSPKINNPQAFKDQA